MVDLASAVGMGTMGPRGALVRWGAIAKWEGLVDVQSAPL